jgi:hypothetical protein
LAGIVNVGIEVVTLSPCEVVYRRGADLSALMMAVVEFSRGHSESKSKADRAGVNWDKRRQALREEGALMTRRVVAWCQEKDGKLVLVPERARIVRRMFELCLQGYGLSLIVQYLTKRKVPCWGWSKTGVWSKTYVRKILTSPATIGVYQPVKNGQPDGPPISNYYPPVIDHSTFHQAQVALEHRKDMPGNAPSRAKVAALFTGLLMDARTQTRLHVAWQTRGVKGETRQRKRVLVNASSMDGAAPSMSFPCEVFEAAALSLLKELSPADVLGQEPESEAAVLAGDKAQVEQRIAVILEQMKGDDFTPALVKVLTDLDRRRQDLEKKLAAARKKESCPQSAAWAEAQSLLEVAQDEPRRLQLRDLLRNIIEECWVLIQPRASHRLCVIQMHFRSDGVRQFLIHYKAAGRGRTGGWSAKSFKTDEVGDGLDLRNADHVERLQAVLEKIDLEQ